MKPPMSVSMKSDLEDRNNHKVPGEILGLGPIVSMKSGLEDRNNCAMLSVIGRRSFRLNEVRPGRPEQFQRFDIH